MGDRATPLGGVTERGRGAASTSRSPLHAGLVLLLVGCSAPSTVDDRANGPNLPSAEGDSSSPAPADSASPSPPEPADAPVEVLPAELAGDLLFTDDEVHPIGLSLDEAAWDSLLTAPATYVQGTFSDGRLSLGVGVRLKGNSSFQPLTGKPSFRISFDHFVDGQRYDGLEAVDLISEVEDPSSLSEALAYRLFRVADLPASRTGFAWLQVNTLDYGLYTLVEKKDDVLIGRVWPDDREGGLYESSSEHWPCDFDDAGDPRCDCWEQDEVGTDSRADLEALCALATDTGDADWYAAVGESIDGPGVLGHMAMEILLGAHDHYAGYMGNVYLYHRPAAARWSLLPASMNSAFGSQRYAPGSCGSAALAPTDFAGGLLARRCWADEACTIDLYAALRRDVDVLLDSDLLVTLDAWAELVGPYAAADPRSGYTSEDFEAQVACIGDWLRARPAALGPYLPAACLGEGGELDIEGWGDLSTNGSCDRSAPDAVSFAVLGVEGARVTLDRPPDGLAVGDEVLLLVAQSTDGEGVGEGQFTTVAGLLADGVLLDPAPEAPVAGARQSLQRVPHYDRVTVRGGGTLTTGAWDGQKGGVLAMRVGELSIEDGGSVSVAGLGYAGGPTGGGYNIDGYQGESVAGPGVGGAPSTEGYNETNGAWAANYGGGGCNVGGGGGEHAGGATAAPSWNGTSSAPEAGEPYGDPSAASFVFGSGGGGVVNLGGSSGPGGAGGGALFIEADTLVAEGAGALSARGADATSWSAGTWSYGAGGGAGGTVWIVAETVELALGAILVEGGAGYSAVTRPGGDGGSGRQRLECGTLDGEVCPEP